jgi:hypothetical protein
MTRTSTAPDKLNPVTVMPATLPVVTRFVVARNEVVQLALYGVFAEAGGGGVMAPDAPVARVQVSWI